MTRELIIQTIRVLLVVGVTLGLMGLVQAGGIDTTDKYAWGTNVGWINFNPTGGGATVYSDHLEGYAWGENIGWIRLGTCSGSPCTHANTTATNYGVNNDGVGNLSGYAWGTNVGWINFNPTGGGVTIDPVTGDFDGYAWGENVGWIHFQNTSPAYKVKTDWRGDLNATYQNNVAAIIKDRSMGPASSGGLSIANSAFLNDNGDGIIFGHNNAAFANVTTDLPGGVDKRWARVWELDINDGSGTTGGNVTLTFDISDAGGTGTFGDPGTYYLLKRATGSSDPFATVTVVSTSVSGDKLTFTVDAGNLGSEFTLGANNSPTAVTLASFTAGATGPEVVLAWETASEVGVLGFNLYRASDADGPYTRINPALIPAQGDEMTGAGYRYVDRPGIGTFSYQLEDVATGGGATRHGPVSVQVAAPHRLYLPLLGRP